MKRWICIFLTVLLVLSLCACGKENNNGTAASIPADNTTSTQLPDFSNTPAQNQADPADSAAATGIDVDLTALSSTMVYSEVYNMMVSPESYVGKAVKMRGQFALYQAVDENGNLIPDQIYFACVIADATACCSQGLEFILAGEHSYPDDYPELGTEITVVGTFQTYEENGYMYCHLVGAKME